MATPEKYSHIDFTPPETVRKQAEHGLKLRREYGRGGTPVGIARARDLANGASLSPSTLRRIKAFFDRHQSDKSAPGFNRGDKEWPSNGLIASKLWGHSAGYAWAKKVVSQMNAADEKSSRSLRPFGSSMGIKPNVCVVHGPPTRKKFDYVSANKSEDDVVFDFGEIMRAISAGGRNESLVSYCMDIRRLIIDRAISRRSPGKTWIVATHVGDELKSTLSDVPVEYVRVDATKEECLCEVEGKDYEDDMKRAIDDFFATEQRSAAVASGVERRFVGNFASDAKSDPSLLRVEYRADPETGKRKTYVIGYAARFGTDSLMLGDFVERIDPRAFGIVESREDGEGRPLETRCLYNHDPNHLLGRFPTTMRLTVDDKGLKYECLLPESRADIAESIARGDLKGSSFSFIVAEGGERWSTENGHSVRVVTKIKSLLDCGPVTYPAYGDSTVAVAKRSYEEYRAFCATGAGGGVDNTCGKSSGSKQGEEKKAPPVKAKKQATGKGKKQKSQPAKKSVLKGAAVGAAVGAATGLIPGGVAGAVAGAIGGAVGGATKTAIENKFGGTKKQKSKRAYDELIAFYAERRGFCPTGDGGGVDNSCGKSMEISKEDTKSPEKMKKAQEFIDKARTEQLSKGGKDKGKPDDSGGVQTWSKGDHFPWTVKQVGDADGYLQGQHPDGTMTEKYRFSGGDTSDAEKKLRDELTGRTSKRFIEICNWAKRRAAR